MNINQVAQTISQRMNLNQDQQNQLTKSIDKARELLNSVNNPQEAISKANIDIAFLDKLKGYINNPIYSMFLPLLGLNKNIALQKINLLEKTLKGEIDNPSSDRFNQVSAQQGQADDLERFRKGLNSFK